MFSEVSVSHSVRGGGVRCHSCLAAWFHVLSRGVMMSLPFRVPGPISLPEEGCLLTPWYRHLVATTAAVGVHPSHVYFQLIEEGRLGKNMGFPNFLPKLFCSLLLSYFINSLPCLNQWMCVI